MPSYQFCPQAPTRGVQPDQRLCFKLSSEVKTNFQPVLRPWREVQISFRLCYRRRSSQRPPFLSHRLVSPFHHRQHPYSHDEPVPYRTSQVSTVVKAPQIFGSISSKTHPELRMSPAQRKQVLVKNTPMSNLAATSR